VEEDHSASGGRRWRGGRPGRTQEPPKDGFERGSASINMRCEGLDDADA